MTINLRLSGWWKTNNIKGLLIYMVFRNDMQSYYDIFKRMGVDVILHTIVNWRLLVLKLCYLKCSPEPSSISITLATNRNVAGITLTYWIRIIILTRSLGFLCVHSESKNCWSGVGSPSCCCTSDFQQVPGHTPLKRLADLRWCWDREHQEASLGSSALP